MLWHSDANEAPTARARPMGQLLPSETSRPHDYRFVSEWLVPAPVEHIAAVFLDPASPLVWWRAGFLRGEILDAGQADHTGTTIRFLSKGFLPYTFQFVLRVKEARHAEGFVAETAGDFNGTMKCWVRDLSENGASALCEWQVLVEQPLIRAFSPVLRPIFAWNHRWVMRQGEKGLTVLARRDPLDAIPRATFPHHRASLVDAIPWKPWTASWELACQHGRR